MFYRQSLNPWAQHFIGNQSAHEFGTGSKVEADFLADTLNGLSKLPKSLPSKYLYDDKGQRLFDAITQTEEYYATRAELSILKEHAGAIVEAVGADSNLIELGTCNSEKAAVLLEKMPGSKAYIAVDVAKKPLFICARKMRKVYPHLKVHPLPADFTQLTALPRPALGLERLTFFMAGSTIGNFSPDEAKAFLQRLAKIAPGASLLIGVDLRKSRSRLEAAYKDRKGCTAAFNLNLLKRINRELNANFDLRHFAHHAFFNERQGRVEMHLKCLKKHHAYIGQQAIAFSAGETIRTKTSYKYSVEEFQSLCREAGLDSTGAWIDREGLFSVHALRF